MEFFNLYQSFFTTSLMFGSASSVTPRLILSCAGLALLVWCGLFVLQGFGLSEMAKRRGIEKRWLAFVPFANLLYLGKLAGDCEVFGHKMKKAGLYAMLAQIVATITLAALTISEALLFTVYASNLTINSTTGSIVWTGLDGFAEVINQFYCNWGDLLCSVVGLIYELLIFLLMMSLLKKYYPKNYLFMSFVQLFVPITRFILIFILRKNTPVDYDAYMRARYEEYARRNAYGDNPYGGAPYGNNPYNRPPYGNNSYGQGGYGNSQNPNCGYENGGNVNNDNPFEEFDAPSEDPFSDIQDYGNANKPKDE